MTAPAFSLMSTIVGTVTLLVCFWPQTGLFWKWRRGLTSTRRVLMEDALKNLYDEEYNGITSTINGLSGALGINRNEAARLLVRLEEIRLVHAHAYGFQLTQDGRKEALRMIRIHRLWERYLADETGLEQTEWHKRAEKLEHSVTAQQVEALVAYTGNPTYDPHGDPIPTASGKLPPKKGKPLTDLEVNDVAKIIHIEDEPGAVFAQLVAEGLHPGLQIRLLEKAVRHLTFIAAGEEIKLAPVVAANVTVVVLPVEDQSLGPFETLASLDIDEVAEVLSISRNCRGQQRRRILDLGVIPGTVISVAMRSASGDPTAYNIRGATIALRKTQAELIRIHRIERAA